MTLTEAAILSFSPAGFILCRCIAEWRGINGIVAMLSEMPDERYVEFVQGFPREGALVKKSGVVLLFRANCSPVTKTAVADQGARLRPLYDAPNEKPAERY
jgi:hypothetical protein